MPEQLEEEALGGIGVSVLLEEDIERGAVLVHGGLVTLTLNLAVVAAQASQSRTPLQREAGLADTQFGWLLVAPIGSM